MKPAQPVLNRARYLIIVIIFFLGLFAIIGSGPTYVFRVSPTVQTSTNDYFVAKISPICNPGCKAFSLTIQNKTNKDIEIDWNRTLYISQGQTTGGFMFEGTVYRDRNNPKPPDVIFAGSTFSKTIWPSNLVHFSGGRYASWMHENMPAGENGVYLTIKVGGEEIRDKLTVLISIEQK